MSSDRPLFTAPHVELRELSNGLNVLVQPDFTAPVVSIQFWCASGSIHETPWLGAGLSHLLEHLMFKGTPTRGNSQMAQQSRISAAISTPTPPLTAPFITSIFRRTTL